MTYRLWGELSAHELKATVDDATVALLPVGAVEQHGPHLPLNTDAALAEGIALAAAKAVTDANILILPTISVAKSDEHLDFPGVLTLDAATLGAVLMQIGKSVARSGVRRLVLLNAHGGNIPVLQTTARALRIEAGMFCVAAGWMSMGYPKGLIPDEELRDGIHGGLVETAAMLHLRPDLVNMAAAQDFIPASRAVAEENEVLRLLGPVSAGWIMSDLNAEGVAGNAAAATPEIGKALVDHAATRYARLLDEVAHYDIPFGAPQP
ncbi:creatininase family protein [Pararhodobacter oceanensis]|uniref:creatininase family protein n=1 Tax=Pararhodobacter oceanensis TaxID=2172121 RepID=UPI003A9271D2